MPEAVYLRQSAFDDKYPQDRIQIARLVRIVALSM